MHQYIVNRTNARDAVNSAHAARSLDLGTSTTLGCAGWSQGGRAAAAVAELDPSDYRDLKADRHGHDVPWCEQDRHREQGRATGSALQQLPAT